MVVNTDQSASYQFRAKVTGVADADIIPTEPSQVQIDKTVPTVTISTLPTTFYKAADGTTLYDDTIKLTLSAADTGSGISGIDKIEYSLNGTTWQDYTGSIAVPSPFAKGTVKARATDKAGKISSIATTAVFSVDNTDPAEPTLNAKVKDTLTGYDLNTSLVTGDTIVVNAVKAANTQKLELQNEDGTWSAFPAGGVTLDTSGTHTVTVRGVGYNGKPGAPTSGTVKILKELPDLSVTVSGIAAEGGTPPWTNQPVSFSLKTENGVSLYNNSTKLGTGRAYSFTETADGTHSYSFTAKNQVNAVSTPVKVYTARIDRTAPAVPSIVITGTPNTQGFYGDDIAVSVQAALNPETPSNSAEKAYYRLYKQGSTAPSYTELPAGGAVPAMTVDGIYTLQTYTSDGAGNQSPVTAQTIKKTSTAKTGELKPQITLSGTPIKTLDGIPIYINVVQAEITATGVGNALDHIEYQFVDTGSTITEDQWKHYNGDEKPSFSDKKGMLYARAVDSAGKTTEEASYATASLIADSRKPAVTLTAPAGIEENKWTTGPVTFSVTGGSLTKDGEAVLSGFASYQVYNETTKNWDDLGTVLDGATVTKNTTGQQKVQVRAVSHAGITGDPASYELWLDNSGADPGGSEAFTIEVTESGIGKASDWYNKMTYTLGLTSGQTVPSGVSYAYSEDDQATWKPLAGNTLTISKATEEAGKKYVFKGISGVNTESQNHVEKTVKIDIVKPVEPKLEIQGATENWRNDVILVEDLLKSVKVPDEINKNRDIDDVNRSLVKPDLRIIKDGEAAAIKEFGENATVTELGSGTYKLSGHSADDASNVSNNTGIEVLKIDRDQPEVTE
ncbi:MAG: hypothetical protein RR614_01535, partial [Eubacterium sp.]